MVLGSRGATTPASAVASGRLAVMSVQVCPAFVVFRTWGTPNPIMVTYAVAPALSVGSTAMSETGTCVVSRRAQLAGPVSALVVTQTSHKGAKKPPQLNSPP